MPFFLYDPSSESLREVSAFRSRAEPHASPDPRPVLACGPTVGGPSAFASLRHAVIDDLLERQLSSHLRSRAEPRASSERASSEALAGALAQLARGELAGEYEPETLRYAAMSVHYRAALVLDAGAPGRFVQLDESEQRLCSLYATKKRLVELPRARIVDVQTAPAEALAKLSDSLQGALEQDLHTALALTEVQDFAVAVNAQCDTALRKQGHINASAVESAHAGFGSIQRSLGLGREAPAAFLQRVRDRRARRQNIDIAAVERTILRRAAARAARDFATADRLQAELLAQNINLLDGAHGTSWTLS